MSGKPFNLHIIFSNNINIDIQEPSRESKDTNIIFQDPALISLMREQGVKFDDLMKLRKSIVSGNTVKSPARKKLAINKKTENNEDMGQLSDNIDMNKVFLNI